MRLKHYPWKLSALIVIITAVGFPKAVPAADPLRYFVGKEVVVVQVSTTVKKTRAIETLKGDDRNKCLIRHQGTPERELCLTETETTTRQGTVGTKLVPDPALSAVLGSAGTALTDESSTVEFRDGMLLASINVQSTGRAGDIIASIAKFAGILIGAPGLLANMGGPEPVAIAVSTCNPFARPLSDQPDIVRLWLWENQTWCTQWDEIKKVQKGRDKFVEDRAAIEHEIRGATDAELKLLLAKLPPIDDSIKQATAELKLMQDAFVAQLEAFTEKLQLGSTSSSRVHDQVLQFRELSPPTGLVAGQPESEIKQIVDTNFGQAAKELWNQARIIVTFDPVVPAKCEVAPQIPNSGLPAKRDEVSIYFRQGAPGRMRIFIADQTNDSSKSTLRVVGDRFDNFVHDCVPVSVATFSKSAWSSRELSLTFDERGRPVKLVRSSKSDVAAVAASLASSATAFRDEMAATVAKTVEVQANKRKIDMDEMTRRLDRVKAEKDILDAQLALDSATANFDTVLKQKQAAADLESLKAELALTTAEATAEQAREIEALKAAVAILNQQLEVLKAQLALDKAKQ